MVARGSSAKREDAAASATAKAGQEGKHMELRIADFGFRISGGAWRGVGSGDDETARRDLFGFGDLRKAAARMFVQG